MNATQTKTLFTVNDNPTYIGATKTMKSPAKPGTVVTITRDFGSYGNVLVNPAAGVAGWVIDPASLTRVSDWA